MLVRQIVTIADAHKLVGRIGTQTPGRAHDRNQHGFHVAGWQVHHDTRLGALGTTSKQGDNHINIGRML